MDLLVKQSKEHWVFGSYQYNGTLNKDNKWANLVPIGVQWGNDPEVNDGWGAYTNPIPIVTRMNSDLKETIINDLEELPPTHLGWNGRLNGPADKYLSSCMSCHMTAQVPVKSQMSPLFIPDPHARPAVGDAMWMKWFRNVPCGEPFDRSE